MTRLFLAVLLSAFAAISANAGLVPISYSMPNGDGGSYSGYTDDTYTSSNCPDCPGYLSGGLGQLTDGITVPSFFGIGEAFTHNYPYMVGWLATSVTITAFFDGTQTFGSVGLHLSDSHGAAGIDLPTTITIGGNQVFSPQPQSSEIANEWHWFTLAPGTTGSSLSIQIERANGSWTFMDEMEFTQADVSGTPEPGTIALALSGLGLVGFLKRRGK